MVLSGVAMMVGLLAVGLATMTLAASRASRAALAMAIARAGFGEALAAGTVHVAERVFDRTRPPIVASDPGFWTLAVGPFQATIEDEGAKLAVPAQISALPSVLEAVLGVSPNRAEDASRACADYWGLPMKKTDVLVYPLPSASVTPGSLTRLESVDELTALLGFARAEVPKVRRAFTPFGQAGVNVNTAE